MLKKVLNSRNWLHSEGGAEGPQGWRRDRDVAGGRARGEEFFLCPLPRLLLPSACASIGLESGKQSLQSQNGDAPGTAGNKSRAYVPLTRSGGLSHRHDHLVIGHKGWEMPMVQATLQSPGGAASGELCGWADGAC